MPADDQSDLLQQAISQAKATQSVQESAPQRQLLAQVQNSSQQPPQYGMGMTALRQGLQGASYGTADEAFAGVKAAKDYVTGNGFDYDQRLQEERKTLSDMQAQHPLLSTLSNMAGTIASPISKLGVGASVLGTAARVGGLAALQGFADGEGGVGNRAEKATVNGVVGFGTAGVIGGAVKGVQALTSPSAAEKTAVAALGGSSGTRQAMKQVPGGVNAVGRKLLDDGLVSGTDTIQQTADKIKKALQATGEQIGGVAQEMDKLAEDGQVPQLDANKIFAYLGNKMKELTQDKANAEQIRTAVAPQLRTFQKQYMDRVMTDGEGALKFSELHAFQSSLKTAYDGADSVTKQALKTLERGLSEKLSDGIETAAKKVGGSQFTNYLQLKNSYRMLSLAQDAVEQGVKRADAGMAGTVERSIYRLGGATAAIRTGNPMYLASFAAPSLVQGARERGMNVLAATLNKASNSVPQSIPDGAARLGQGALLQTLQQLSSK